MSLRVSRRGFLKGAAAAGGLLVLSGPFKTTAYAANAKLSIAYIGAGGQGKAGWGMAEGQNVVAICDVDLGRPADFIKSHPEAKTYTDWREVYKNHKDLNLVHVATPDHTHFPAASAALRRNYPCYCEKPLTHSIWEARTLADLARKAKAPTQMGNMGHANEYIRRIVEWVQAGTIGDVKEVHTWTNRPVWPQGKLGPFKSGTPPEGFNWDAWLGVAPKKDYFVDDKGQSPVHPFSLARLVRLRVRGRRRHGLPHVGLRVVVAGAGGGAVGRAGQGGGPGDGHVPEADDREVGVRAERRWASRPAFTAYWYEGGLKPEVPEEIRNDATLRDRQADAGHRREPVHRHQGQTADGRRLQREPAPAAGVADGRVQDQRDAEDREDSQVAAAIATNS